jgi:hypothetical protein
MQQERDNEAEESEAKPTITIAEDDLESPDGEKKPTITIAEKNG